MRLLFFIDYKNRFIFFKLRYFEDFTFFIEEHRTFSSFLVCQNNLIGLAAILCRFLDG